jgi:hypothetical protein
MLHSRPNASGHILPTEVRIQECELAARDDLEPVRAGTQAFVKLHVTMKRALLALATD